MAYKPTVMDHVKVWLGVMHDIALYHPGVLMGISFIFSILAIIITLVR